MPAINSRLLRAIVSHRLRDLNRMFGLESKEGINVGQLDEIVRVWRGARMRSRHVADERLSDDLSLLNLGICVIALLSLSIYDDEYPEEVFPSTWISAEGVPNANFILQCLLCQITNYSVATVDMTQSGLDNPARTLLRATIELCWQTLCLAGNREDFQYYASNEDATETWKALFAGGKIHRKLLAIERTLGIPEEFALQLREWRRELIKFHSQAVHHSFLAVSMGSLARESKEDVYSSTLFGRSSVASKTTADDLAFVHFYFLKAFFSILGNMHGLRPRTPSKDFWRFAIILKECLVDLYPYMAEKNRQEREALRTYDES